MPLGGKTLPINDLRYRSWETKTRARPWWVITQTGIQLAWQSNWLKRLQLLAWLPAAVLGAALFVFERSAVDPNMRQIAPEIISRLPDGSVLDSGAISPNNNRREVWAFLLLTLFRYPQGFLMVLLVGLIAPSLIARDMRSRAFLLYFSRPLDRFDYILGKSAIVWAYLALVTTVPALALYALGVALSPDLGVVVETWDLPLRILAASVCLIVPTTSVAMAFSSLTTETRYASFAWFATWVLGWVAYVNLRATQLSAQFQTGDPVDEARWSLLSFYHTLGRVQSWVFGLETGEGSVGPALTLLLFLTAGSTAILMRRVAAPLRI